MMVRTSLSSLVLLAGLSCGLMSAQEAPDRKQPKGDPPREWSVKTRHTVKVDGNELAYQAEAGTLILKGADDAPRAEIFFIAYTKPDAEASRRPITFTFNGGPGSSSVWLHMGTFGPRRVPVGDVGDPVAPPYGLVDNAWTLLDVTDLVFIDPVSTGYSRTAPGKDGKEFHGVQQDLDAVGEFIRLYTTRHGRWDSPKFLAGESYGTTRAAGLVGLMQNKHGMNFNGVILISAVLNFQTIRPDEGNDLPYPLFLPSYTATAWYHQALPAEAGAGKDLGKLLKEVEAFAQGDYTVALMKGRSLGETERRQTIAKLARFTGLSEEYISRGNLRIEPSRFRQELLRRSRKHVGRFDSRYVGFDLDANAATPGFDPSYTAVQGPFTAVVNRYLRQELKVEKDAPYEILTGKVQPWDYGSARNRYLNVAPVLQRALTENRQLHLFLASGLYDLATPYFAADYTLNQLDLDAQAAARTTTAYYEAGHMMYLHRPSLEKLKRDLAGFIRTALRGVEKRRK